jgi:Tfp pilus assembly major pilin PilA
VPIKWDKEKIALSIAGSLATLTIGYLIWRHENTVQQNQVAENQAASAAQDAELEQELASLPQYTQGGGASEEDNDTGSDSTIASPPSDDNIAAILAAFGLGSQPATTSTPPVSTPTTPVPVTPPSGATPVGPAQPVPIVNPPSTPVTPVANPVVNKGHIGQGAIGAPNPSPIITRATPPFSSPTATPAASYSPE